MEIQNYPNYLIYPDGRVWSQRRKIFMKPSNHYSGYKLIQFSKEGTKKTMLVHRLVAIHYIQNPHDYEDVDHIDRDKSNNDISNLRWVSKSQNSQNIGLKTTNTSGVKNICPMNDGRLMYTKTINGKRFVKTFKSKPLACWCKFIFELTL